jgi:hypothetical protein
VVTAAASRDVCNSQLGGAAGLLDASNGLAPRRARRRVCVQQPAGVCAAASRDGQRPTGISQRGGARGGGALAGGYMAAQVLSACVYPARSCAPGCVSLIAHPRACPAEWVAEEGAQPLPVQVQEELSRPPARRRGHSQRAQQRQGELAEGTPSWG